MPPMRIAVLADIHGHLPALEAVLGEAEAAGVDAVLLNGDIAAGPLPGETLDRLVALGERAVWIRGNADRWMVEAFDGTYEARDHPADDFVRWAGSQLSQSHRDLLAAAPLTVRLEVDGLGAVRFCHATTRDDDEVVLVDTPVARYAEAFAGTDEPTVVLGHTHMPFDRLADRRRFVNPGSVGMPYGHGGAAWALLGPTVQLRRTDYDIDAAVAQLRTSGWPGVEEWIGEYVLRSYSDAEALTVFTPMSDEGPRGKG
jgi:putative phosphoesterase